MIFIVKVVNKLIDLSILLIFGRERFARHKGVRIGTGCRIIAKEWGTEPFLVHIGDRVTIADGVRILTHDGSTWLVRDEAGVRFQKYGRVTIGNDVFVGVNAIILPGVTIGNQVIVGAGAVVTRDVPSNSVVVGIPARVVNSFTDYREGVLRNCLKHTDIDWSLGYKSAILRCVE